MPTIYDFTVSAADGTIVDLSEYRDRVVLVVNVASKCGYTPQYEGLEALYDDLHGKGLEILGFPNNQFGDQEPGTDAEIQEFCSLTYGVNFPVLAKIDVNGDDAAPLYTFLRSADPGHFDSTADGAERLAGHLKTTNPASLENDEVRWNFTKFLVGTDGQVIRRYESYVSPRQIRGDVESLLNM